MHENSGFLDTNTERELIKKPHCNSSHKDIHSLLTLCKI